MPNWTPEQVEAHYRRLGLSAPANLAAVNKQAKYRNVKKEVDGIKFDSTKEARRYVELKLMQLCGEISGLQLQPRFLLQPGFLLKGRKIREIAYVADFQYVDKDRHSIVEDVKSKATKTQAYRLKRKMLLAAYPGIDHREIL